MSEGCITPDLPTVGDSSLKLRSSLEKKASQSVRSRILAAIATKDRTIERQSLVMSLATQVLTESSLETAVMELVNATYRVVDCERVSLFMIEDDELVCAAAPVDGRVGWRIPLGHGIAGHVAVSGETLNIRDAYERLDLFDPTFDRQSKYRTESVLAMPVREGGADGDIVGVLQVINKRGIAYGERAVFDKSDEQMLQLLLGLTAHQIRMCTMMNKMTQASSRQESTLRLVNSICQAHRLDDALMALARSTRSLVRCQHACVFLMDQGSLVCRASSGMFKGDFLGVRLGSDLGVTQHPLARRRVELFHVDEHASQLEELRWTINSQGSPRTSICAGTAALTRNRRGPSVPQLVSTLCSPLQEDRGCLGLLVAMNRELGIFERSSVNGSRVASKEDAADCDRASFTRGAGAKSSNSLLGAMLRQNTGSPGSPAGKLSTFEQQADVGPFLDDDVEQLEVLLQLAGQFVKTSKLYDSERRTATKFAAMISLISDAQASLQSQSTREFASLILAKSVAMFECDRCTFFTVDNLNSEFLGYFIAEGSGDLQELRIPIKGIAGCVATTKQLLNIRDAWSDSRFCNDTDLRTGYRTRTLLCAPLCSSAGKVIAVVQCVNKLNGEFFSPEDENMLWTVSRILSDLLQNMFHRSGYMSFVDSNDAIDSDVKEMFREFHQVGTAGSRHTVRRNSEAPLHNTGHRISGLFASSMDLSEATFLAKLRSWDTDFGELAEEPNKNSSIVRLSMSYFNLTARFNISGIALDGFVVAIRSRYSQRAAYHNWPHAFTTLHAIFLLLDSWAFWGLLPEEDELGLLLAALGHDVEHPGFTNNFLVNTRHNLALRYNDISVLESHHASTTCTLLASDRAGDVGVFDKMSADNVRRVRLVIVTAILGTDMAKHQEAITWLESKNMGIEIGPSSREKGETLGPDESLKLASALLHSADLVHPALPWHIHKRRSLQIAEEFFHQYSEETRLGLPTLPFMGKDPKVIGGFAPIQTGFIQFVAAPLWSAVNFAAGEDRLRAVNENVEHNRSLWQKIAEGQEVSNDQPFKHPPNATAEDGEGRIEDI